MKKIVLNDGNSIDALGTGTNTYGKEGNVFDAPINDDITELASAINLGYRLIDTAIMYRNESVIGKAWKASGLDRKEFFLTSKIPADKAYTKDEHSIRRSVRQSLDALHTSYIDLYLIHHPWDDLEDMLRVYRVLEDLVDEGALRSIGVSNFTIEQLDYLVKHARYVPVVNQIESHPNHWNNEMIAYGKANGVVIQAWYPLKKINEETIKIIQGIADKYKKTWAQVVLNYQIDRNVVVIPKSHQVIHQQENIEIFDFELTEEEKALMYSL